MVKIVSEKPVKTDTYETASGWLGGKDAKGPTVYVFDDGYEMYPYVRDPQVKDWDYIMQGCTDVSGAKFKPYMDEIVKGYSRQGKEAAAKQTHLNWLELVHHEGTPPAGDPSLARIEDYAGDLTSDPNQWPEPYKSAYDAGH